MMPKSPDARRGFLPVSSPQSGPIKIARREQKKFPSKKLVLFLALIILALGSAAFMAHPQPTSFSPPEPAYPVAPSTVIETTPVTSPVASQMPPPTAASVIDGRPTLTDTTSTAIEHVVIITIDGLRPDALDLTHTPTLDDLRARGAFNPTAQTISLSETLPSHASMVSGVLAHKHGIQWGVPYIGWPGMNGPTIFSLAHEAGLSTGMVFGKQKLHYLVLPNSVDKLFGGDVHDETVKEQALEFIETGLPNILFVHFPDTDRVGHAYGWLSTNQLHSITFADGLIGEIVAALKKGGYLNRTLLIVTSDHGGHDRVHGNDCWEDRTIPWLAVGPGVPRGVVLTGPINTYDTAATALYAFDLPIPENWDGRPVLEIFPGSEN
jgi:hypothetical protein